MKNKLMRLDVAVRKFVKDRMSIAAGGFPLARQANIFSKEILRQNKSGGIRVRDLFWIEPGIGFGGSMMLAEGIIDSVISTFSSHERAGLSVITRDSLEKGIPFLDPSVLLQRYRLERILQIEKSGLPISHYTDFGNKVAGRLYAAEIKKIMGLP